MSFSGLIVQLLNGLAAASSLFLVAAFRGLQVDTPFGRITYRPEDNQSTMGAFLGRTKNDGGKGVLVDYRYLDGANFLPNAAEVRKLRPAN